MPTIKQRLAQYLQSLIPTRTVTRHDARGLTPSAISTITPEQVLEYIQEAEGGSTEHLFALYRDVVYSHSHLQGRFDDRKRAVLGDVLSLQPFDKKSPQDKEAVDAVWPLTLNVGWDAALNHLLDATLWPVAVVEKVYRVTQNGVGRYELDRLVPVPHDLLAFQNGRLQIWDTDEQGRKLGTVHECDSTRYIVHRGHLLTAPDNWGGPMRSLLFWFLLGTMAREWWARFLDRYGAPFVVGKYPGGDDATRSVMERAFSLATKLGGLIITSDSEVEIKQAAATDSGEAFARFQALCNDEISKLILGQTLSSTASPTGLGSGVANAQSAVRDDIRQFDARWLGKTLSAQLATQFLKINGLVGRPPIFIFGSVSASELSAKAQLLTALPGAGLRVADTGIELLSESTGLPLERVVAPASPFGAFSADHLRAFGAPVHTSAAEKLDPIARDAAAMLSRTLGRDYAPIKQIILDSAAPEECLARVTAHCSTYDAASAARIMQEVLLAYAANGATAAAR